MEAIIGVTEAAKRLGVTDETIRDWARRGRLPAFKIGKSWLFNVPEIESQFGKLLSGHAGNDKQIADIVREHISTIEFALLGMSNSETIGEYINMTSEEIAGLANQLREAVSVRAD